jgi:hypothetical protein
MLTACATGGLGGLLSPTLTGALSVQRPAEEIVLTPARCVSGDRWSFFGVDLITADGAAAIRIVIDPIAGPRIRLRLPGAEARPPIVLDEARCSTFQADVHHNGWTVNDFRGVDGQLALDCALGADERVRGAVTFRQCH